MDAMDDYDVNDFMGSDFVQKDELKLKAQRKRITSAEQRDGLPKKNGKVLPELVLVFSDERSSACGRARTRKRSATTTGRGRAAESARGSTLRRSDRRNPSGAKVGGIRIRIPDDDGGPVDFTSDLEGATDEAEQADPAKVPV